MAAKKQKPKAWIRGSKEELLAIALITIFGLTGVSLLFPPDGILGNYGKTGLAFAFGKGQFVVPFLFLAWGVSLWRNRDRIHMLPFFTGGLLSLLALLGLIHILVDKTEWFTLVQEGGGYAGAAFSWPASKLLGKLGGSIILLALIPVGGIMAMEMPLAAIGGKVTGWMKFVWTTITPDLEEDAPVKKSERASRSSKSPQAPVVTHHTDAQQDMELTQRIGLPAAEEPPTQKIKIEDFLKPSSRNGSYELPPVDFLKPSPPPTKKSKDGSVLSVQTLTDTLRDFDVDAEITRVVEGPTVTLYELTLGPGVKVGRIVNLADDISLAMATPDIRILAPIPGKRAIGIEVPNQHRDLITIGDLFHHPEAKTLTSPLAFAVGKDISGKPVFASLAEMPHLLIAGATGSGKSVALNTLICSMLMRATPEQMRMILVDPKLVELQSYNGLPHLLTPVVTNPRKAAAALIWAVGQMEERYQLLFEVGVRHLLDYNKLLQKESPDIPQMSYMVIVIDELADLMMTAAREVEDAICRLAQMGRAVGIHLVLATQRPSVDVITGLIKANITSRMAFAVSSQTDSRVVLDTPGAEKLIGKGDMLFHTPKDLRPHRLQGAFVAEEEIQNITRFISSQGTPQYIPDVTVDPKAKASGESFADPMLDQAVEIILNAGQASVSLLQRRLGVGYTRAGRLVDLLEERGIISGFEGSKPRELLITREQWAELSQQKSGMETETHG